MRLRPHRSSLSSVAPRALLLALPASSTSSVLARLTPRALFFGRSYTRNGVRSRRSPGAARRAARHPRCLHLPRPRRLRALRRQGEVAAQARALVLPAPLRPDEEDEGAGPIAARNGLHPKVGELVARIARVETIVTGSESERSSSRQPRQAAPPALNIRPADDKSYPYIGISLDEEYPRVYFTRERHHRDRLYFGPFSSASKVRETLNLIAKIFPSRPCEGPEPGRPSGVPCLDYHIKRCLAPCVGYISKRTTGR